MLCLKRGVKRRREGGGEGGGVSEVCVRGCDFILCEMGIERSILDKGGKDVIYIWKRPLQMEKMGQK